MLTQNFNHSKAQSLPRIIPNRLGGAIEFLGIPKNFPCNAEIYGECEPADYLYKIVSGTVKAYRVCIDGRRQIGGFYLPSDIFGVEVGEEHAFSAEAISDCQVLLINRRAIMCDVACARPHVRTVSKAPVRPRLHAPPGPLSPCG